MTMTRSIGAIVRAKQQRFEFVISNGIRDRLVTIYEADVQSAQRKAATKLREGERIIRSV